MSGSVSRRCQRIDWGMTEDRLPFSQRMGAGDCAKGSGRITLVTSPRKKTCLANAGVLAAVQTKFVPKFKQPSKFAVLGRLSK